MRGLRGRIVARGDASNLAEPRRQLVRTKVQPLAISIWLGVELVQARPGFQSFGYGMIKPSPFRLVVRTSSFHVEDTGSIPVRDNLLGEASEGPPRVGQEVHGTVP